MNGKTDERTSGLSILVIEDSELYQDLIAKTLKKEGHRCEAALDGESAIEKVKARNYDMAFLDLKLPGRNGFEVHRLLAELCPDMKVIFITGNSNQETVDRMKSSGAFGYILKPFELGSIRDTVSDIATGSAVGMSKPPPRKRNEIAHMRERVLSTSTLHEEIPLKRPRFGRIATLGGLVTAEQLMECLAIQRETKAAGRPARLLGEIMTGEGYLTRRQVNAILKIQTASSNAPEENRFGRIALHNSFINKNQLKECIKTQERLALLDGRSPLLGHIMMEKGYLSESQMHMVLKVQSRKFREGLLERLKSQSMSPTRRAAVQWSFIRRKYPALHAWGLTALLTILIVFSFTIFRRMRLFEPRIQVIAESGEVHRVSSRELLSRSKSLGEQLYYALYCEKCAVYFPLDVETLDNRKYQLKPCPKCGKLDETELPGSMAKALARRKEVMEKKTLPDKG